MRWMKHMCNSQDDELMATTIERFGAEGYGAWWIIMEKIASLMDKSERTSARYPTRKWQQYTGLSAKKLRDLLDFWSCYGNITVVDEGIFITVCNPNLAKYRDEYSSKGDSPTTGKSRQYRDKIPTVSGARTDTDTDAETDTETDPEEPTSLSPEPQQKEVSPSSITKLWNEVMATKGFPKVLSSWPDVRKDDLRRRIREDKCRNNLEWWREFFVYIQGSAWLSGKIPPKKDRKQFICRLPWVLDGSGENMAKILEGFYHGEVKFVPLSGRSPDEILGSVMGTPSSLRDEPGFDVVDTEGVVR